MEKVNMAEYERVRPDETYTYKANLPSWPLALGLMTGYMYGLGAHVIHKYPMKQGVIKYLPRSLVVGAAVGYTIDYAFKTYRRKQLTFAEEYRARNPEDFIEPPSQTYGELFLPWAPAR